MASLETHLEALQTRFSAASGVTFENGLGGLPRLSIRTVACEADIYLQGAHVTHFQPAGHKPLLFLSAQSEFASGKPIRGGVPVIFPWFGPREGAPLHGVVRLMEWEVENVRLDGENVVISLTLSPEEAPHAAWPGKCALRYEITAGSSLRLSLTVENLDEKPLRYEAALHTYFAVGDVRQMEIQGLQNAIFLDKTEDFAEKTQLEGQLRLNSETDRVYKNTQATCIIHDEANARRITVAKENSDTTVVWNPWIAKAAAMPDFGDEEWPFTVCIETCNVMDSAIELAVGAAHTMTAEFGVENA